jgi:signal transduction histidine kinase
MHSFRKKFALRSIRNKIVITFLFGCLVAFFSWVIAHVVFKETFSTIDAISSPNPKLAIVNTLFQKIHRLDQVQKLQVLKFPNKPYTSFTSETKYIMNLLDSLKAYCATDTFQLSRVKRMQKILGERDELFRNYLSFRSSLSLSKDIHSLSDYISRNIKKPDSSVVRTTRKSTVTTSTVINPQVENKKPEKKESFFRRLFGRKKNSAPQPNNPEKLVTEDVQVTIDTFAISQRDSFIKDMELVIAGIEKKQTQKGSGLIDHELKLTAASNVFIDELQQLLHQIQQEEIRDMQGDTASLGDVFDRAFTRVGAVLVVFFILALVIIFLIFSDISQTNKNRLELIEAKERAEHLEQVKHRFMANMSHEIRTPLQAIIGYAEQVKEQEHPKKEALEAIYSSSEYLLQIVNEVLDYSRIISGKFVFEKQDFDMGEVLAEVSDVMEGQAEKKNIRFKFKGNLSTGTLYSGDSFRLKQILYNLLGNAIKFTQQGEVSFYVDSKNIGSKKTEFTFEVKDTGIGMTEQEMKRIFKSFEQAGESTQRQYGGTGLGLSIVKTLTEMQGGTISVQSEKNTGSSFTVKICYLRSLTAEREKQTAVSRYEPVYQGKVAVIDDDEFILSLCRTILQKHRIDHVCYASPEQALQGNWDAITLVLMDMRMPVISGYELYPLLKEKVNPTVKFVALTAQALPEEKAAIIKLGFDKVLLKPFREKDLVDLFMDPELPVPMPSQSFTDHFDLSLIASMCMNDKELLKKNLELLSSQTQLDVAALEKAAEINDEGKIWETSHRLSSKMGQIGLNNLSHQLRSIERDARDPKKHTDNSLLGEVIKRIKEANDTLKKHLVAFV